MRCPTCSSQVPDDARFCPSCGQSVTAPSAEERRIVTVLFADLVGFTALAEYLDPESVKSLVDGCFHRVVDVIANFGGRVDKLLGDGVVALFGAPVAHEDDAERAVRCALRIQQTVDEYGAAQHIAETRLQMRIGVNTGEVLTGTVAGTDYTAMGDAVNTASRLQTLADPGSVLVGPVTYALTSHTIRYDDAGSAELRGREQSVQAWRAVEATSPPGRRSRRGDVPLVGRANELALARAALDIAVHQRHSVVVTITGDSGVGKSRLADELIAGLGGDQTAVLQGGCVPYGEANQWWPVASALSDYLGLDTTAPLDELRAAAEVRARALGDHLHDSDIAHLVDTFTLLMGHPSSLDRLDPAAQRAVVHQAVSQVVSLRAARQPLLLAISDLHWADQAVIDLLTHLAVSLHRLPVALVVTMRSGADVAWPPQSDRLTSAVVHLHPLSQQDTAQLAMSLLSDDAPSEGLLTALYERSGGNPLFVQELAALSERGGALTELPDSLRSLIGARLDQLTAEQRQVLDNAATLGTSGLIGSLARFAEAMGQDFDPVTVDELEDLGLLDCQGRRWFFRSESVRDAAYQTITKANRALRHVGVATAMSGMSAGPLDEIAHHLASAAELTRELGRVRGVPADIGNQAVEALFSAAVRAVDSGSHRVAVRHATRALDLIDDSHPMKVELLLLRSSESIDRRAYDDAEADINAVLAVAMPAGDIWAEGEARRRLGSLHHVRGHMPMARVEMAAATDLLRRTDRRDSLAAALRARGFIELFGGGLHDAEQHFAEADALYRQLGDERGMAWIEQHRAWLSFLSGDIAVADARLRHAASTLESLGDRNGVGWAKGLLAFVEFFQRNFDEAERLARSVGSEADERGDEWAGSMMEVLRADLALWRGDLNDAVVLAESARARFRKLADRYGQLQASAPLVRAQIALGRTNAVQRTLEEVLAAAEGGAHGPYPLMVAAGASMHRGDAPAAVTLAEQAVQAMVAAGAGTFEPRVILAMSLAQAGRAEEAAVQLAEASALGEHSPFFHSAAALVAELCGDHAGCVEQLDKLRATRGASYLDEVVGYVAGAAAYRHLGDLGQAELCAEAAIARALHVGDVVAISVAMTAYAALTGRQHSAADSAVDLSPGWADVVAGLFDPGR
jgi:class 3 adenylate cyclase/tetratricopeptide (TPR) repeat protein